MQKRLKHQSVSFDAKVELDNMLAISNLSDIDTTVFKNYFEFVESLKNKISMDLKGIKNIYS